MAKTKASHKFITVLSIVSILGFIGIVTQSLFELDITYYIESLWIIIMGVGFILETNIKSLKSLNSGITTNNFAYLTTFVIGILALFAGILSFPGIRVTNPSFVAIKGIISIIAVLVIVIQTWVIDSNN